MEARKASSGITDHGLGTNTDAAPPDAAPPESQSPAPLWAPECEDAPLTAEDCAIGQVLAERYRVEGLIGRGSMGVVVAATHLGFDELVAIKFIRPEMRHMEGIVARFAREAKASVRVRNAHAVNVLDVGVTDPIGPFFAMEYLWGSHLEELIDARGPLSVSTAALYVLQACEALAAAHAQGIIHRDIKPQNMFLARQGTLESLKVLDFGISKAPLSGQVFGDDLSTRERDWVMGTPLYMSPEQLRHAPDLDERTDIWSLGTVLYELLTGEPRFSGDTHTQVARQILSAPAPVEEPLLLAGVPGELRRVIRRCLAHERGERFANVAELAHALAPFAPPSARSHVERALALLGLEVTEVSDEDIEDLDVAPFEELPPPRHRSAWLAVIALAALVACVAVGLGWRYLPTNASWRARPTASRAETSVETERLALQPPPRVVVTASPAAATASPAATPTTTTLPSSALPSSPAPWTARSAPSSTPARPALVTPASATRSKLATADVEAQTPARPAPAQRLLRPKPAAEPTFRLIAEPPRTKFALLPPSPRSEAGTQLAPPK